MPESQLDQNEWRWQQLLQRQTPKAFPFFYGVTSTGIYCYPHCSSRRPKRENVRFFDDQQQAENAGFRPCKRCKPNLQEPEGEPLLLKKACALLTAEEGVTLQRVAQQLDITPWRLTRLFKKWLHITPKAFAMQRQQDRLRAQLLQAESVTEAIYAAGYNTSSRGYAAVDQQLGMTPTQLRRGGEGVEISYGMSRCYLGWVMVAMTQRGICSIQFGDDEESCLELLNQQFPKAHLHRGGASFVQSLQAVVHFLDQPQRGLDLPLDIQGTAFQQRIWKLLLTIPAGQVVTYSALAQMYGNPRAVRAVARACASNRIGVAIPCHRVVGKKGAITGYRWGVERKQLLLDKEQES
ncbi:bifunctional DNA-binding transcriptional regulator/O6-methylguanine-DNA methyltransferase Ada [Magnetococcus sp. PR-3]|uniref:bifunctional DNA-binding transcriptional regulator/O6-methylguanine-DNA methyltransferase Ada n=1 Tax=Magnetococcus sp. PR-3 TaxID=3120355 RepID=UPI002FCE4FCF